MGSTGSWVRSRRIKPEPSPSQPDSAKTSSALESLDRSRTHPAPTQPEASSLSNGVSRSLLCPRRTRPVAESTLAGRRRSVAWPGSCHPAPEVRGRLGGGRHSPELGEPSASDGRIASRAGSRPDQPAQAGTSSPSRGTPGTVTAPPSSLAPLRRGGRERPSPLRRDRTPSPERTRASTATPSAIRQPPRGPVSSSRRRGAGGLRLLRKRMTRAPSPELPPPRPPPERQVQGFGSVGSSTVAAPKGGRSEEPGRVSAWVPTSGRTSSFCPVGPSGPGSPPKRLTRP